jgi:DNA-binding transcriptional LysR family regulator
VASNKGTAGARCLVALCAQAGFEPRINYQSNDYAVVRGLVQSGLGIALVPGLGYQPTENVVTATLTGPRRQRHVSAVYRKQNSNPLLPLAMQCLQDAARLVSV